jgi:DNA-directed RNA polymerase specialized sigma24 family protein
MDSQSPCKYFSRRGKIARPLFLLAEELESLLARLREPALRQVAMWKLEGYTNAEIAQRQGCSLPTVERRLALIRRLLKGG